MIPLETRVLPLVQHTTHLLRIHRLDDAPLRHNRVDQLVWRHVKRGTVRLYIKRSSALAETFGDFPGRTLLDLSRARDYAGDELADALNQRTPEGNAQNVPDNTPTP